MLINSEFIILEIILLLLCFFGVFIVEEKRKEYVDNDLNVPFSVSFWQRALAFIILPLIVSFFFLFLFGLSVNTGDIIVKDKSAVIPVKEDNQRLLQLRDIKTIIIKGEKQRHEDMLEVQTKSKDSYLVEENFLVEMKVNKDASEKQKIFSVEQSFELANIGSPKNLSVEECMTALKMEYIQSHIEKEIQRTEKANLTSLDLESIANDLSVYLSSKTIFDVKVSYLKK